MIHSVFAQDQSRPLGRRMFLALFIWTRYPKKDRIALHDYRRRLFYNIMINLGLYRVILAGLVALLIVTIIWAIRGRGKVPPKHRHGEAPSSESDPMRYLQTLYAKGEISKEEYEARKKKLAT